MIYAGNLHVGRWKTLQKLAEAIKEINKDNIKIQLDIYTGKSVSDEKLNRIKIDNSIKVHDFIPYSQLIEIQKKSDILLHVESFNLKERLITFLSFSTKIVDFFEMGKCILAIGWEQSAPIKYLLEKDAALVITDTNKIQSVLTAILDTPDIIVDYKMKARKCGQSYHERDKVLSAFKSDLINSINKAINL